MQSHGRTIDTIANALTLLDTFDPGAAEDARTALATLRAREAERLTQRFGIGAWNFAQDDKAYQTLSIGVTPAMVEAAVKAWQTARDEASCGAAMEAVLRAAWIAKAKESPTYAAPPLARR